MQRPEVRAPWWETAVLYQIYPRSFADSDGDGVGDLQGIVDHLEHLSWLGVDGVWLSPITPSPNADWGYDVSDFCAVHPELGALGAFDELVSRAHALGIRVLLDFVPNHTSEQHPWFIDARATRASPKRDWYVWADARDGAPPNNWVSSFGGRAWTFDEASGQYYLHNHLSEQPDLNWWNDEVRDEFDAILRFWLDRGVDGFRIDVCNGIVKDAELRDNPPATADDPLDQQLFGQRPVYNANRPEVHDVLRRWRHIVDGYEPPRLLIGETPVDDAATLGAYYGAADDELQLAFNFPFITSSFEASAMRTIVGETEANLPERAWPAWTGSNHDMGRLATRWADDDPARIRAALTMLLTLRGTPVLYQGDEIGLGEVAVEPPRLRDPLGVRYWPAYAGRDAERTPMPWSAAPNGGFADAGAQPWLPLGDPPRNVAGERADSTSILNMTRDLLALRRSTPDLNSGSYTELRSPDHTWAWRRGSDHIVAINMSGGEVVLEIGSGAGSGDVVFSSNPAHAGGPAGSALTLSPWEAVIVQVDTP